MKKVYILLLAIVTVNAVNAQAVLNEIYAFPSAGNHEFFELYNTSTSQVPVSVDGYTLVTYYEEPGKKGFYVMDLPNLSMSSKGFLVGSSKIPFNYQGNANITRSDFCWNDPDFRSGLTGGSLKKWYLSNTIPLDGNPQYDEEVLPLDFNDFFDKKSGSGASFNAFLYKDGLLVNSFVGGAGGNTFIPAFITSLPPFNFTNNNNGTINTYTVDHTTYSSGIAEYVTQDIGTDNGFIRKSDGMCGTWDKSSAQAFHTPQQTNGGSQMTSTGALTIDTHISRGVNGDSSFIVYNITAGPTYMFPVDLYVYADNGTVVGQWDASDEFLEGNLETVVGDGPFTTYFAPDSQQLILVTKTDVGCYDQVRLVLNPNPPVVVLPVTIKQFTGKPSGDNCLLEWVVENTEVGSSFEIERSIDGRAFSRVSTVSANATKGQGYYSHLLAMTGPAYYRLNVVHADKSSKYSNVVFVKPAMGATNVTLLHNPVAGSSLNLIYQAEVAGRYNIAIYNSSGTQLSHHSYTWHKGRHMVQLPLDKQMPAGAYLLEFTNEQGNRQTMRFIKL